MKFIDGQNSRKEERGRIDLRHDLSHRADHGFRSKGEKRVSGIPALPLLREGN